MLAMRAATVPQRMHCRLPRSTGLSYPVLTEKVDILLSFLLARTGGHPVQFPRYITLSEDTTEIPSEFSEERIATWLGYNSIT
jgi:hypothetical protein